jgi:fructose-bisphosphate aldolase class II
MVSYKELGLSNTKELFAKAHAGKYAIPAFNFNNMEQLQAIVQACVETKSPDFASISRCTQICQSKQCFVIWHKVL